MRPPLAIEAPSESEPPIREPMRFFIPRFVVFLFLVLVLTVIGVVGYVLIEGWGFLDALYMTVITLTAVGYEEVHPLSESGRTFTMVLLAGGITGMGVWFALLTALIVELDLRNVFRRRQTMKEIEKMEDHMIVCGAGGTGRQVVTELVDLGHPFVVIEKDPDQAEQVYEIAPDAQVVVADATEDHALEIVARAYHDEGGPDPAGDRPHRHRLEEGRSREPRLLEAVLDFPLPPPPDHPEHDVSQEGDQSQLQGQAHEAHHHPQGPQEELQEHQADHSGHGPLRERFHRSLPSDPCDFLPPRPTDRSPFRFTTSHPAMDTLAPTTSVWNVEPFSPETSPRTPGGAAERRRGAGPRGPPRRVEPLA